MSNHPDWENENFDDFIRRSVEETDIPFDPKAWQAMEQKLNAAAGGKKNAGKGGYAGKRIAGLAIALLLLSGLGWIVFLSPPGQEQTAEKMQLSEKLTNAGDAGASFLVNKKKKQPAPEPDKSAAKGEKQIIQEEETASHSAGKSLLSGEESLLMKTAERAKGEEPQARALSGAKEQQATTEMKLVEKKGWIPFKRMEPDVQPVALGQPEREEAAVIPPKVREVPLSLSLSLAPDFSGTAQTGSMKTGAGIGLHLEYKIRQRLSIVSGAFYSKKNYLTDNSLSPYGQSGGYGPEPEHIDASCAVIDIPLNLRFYALNGHRHKIFLSGGISSYFMLSEDYTLVYNSGYYKDYTYEVRNENRHFFAIYNLSAGYERNLTSRWALQLEPFIKIPARGVGMGFIKLKSMGAFVHLKYKIGKQKVK